MKESRWDSTLCLLIPTWMGPFIAGFFPSCGVGRDERSGVGWRGRSHSLIPDFLLTEYLREEFFWCACSGWAQPNPADMRCRGAADQIYAKSSVPFAWMPCNPSASHMLAHTCTHTTLHRNLQAFIWFSTQTHPCPIQLNKHVLFVLKWNPENICTSSCMLSWKSKSCFIYLTEKQIRNYMWSLANLLEDEIWSFLVWFSLLVFR